MVRESVESVRYRKGKGLWRKGFAEEPSLEFRMAARTAGITINIATMEWTGPIRHNDVHSLHNRCY